MGVGVGVETCDDGGTDEDTSERAEDERMRSKSGRAFLWGRPSSESSSRKYLDRLGADNASSRIPRALAHAPVGRDAFGDVWGLESGTRTVGTSFLRLNLSCASAAACAISSI